MSYSSEFLRYCAGLGIKLTALRKEVLYLLWVAARPLKAYEILESLLQSKPNSKPPTVYRALIYFCEIGIVHKIESIQSYTLCAEPLKKLQSEVLMVCNLCRQVREVHNPSIQNWMQQLAEQNQFTLGMDTIELKGLCDICQSIREPSLCL